MPARRPKLAIAFLARVTTAFWPVIRPSSSTAASSCFGFLPGVAHAHVEHDLLESRHLVRIAEPELLLQPRRTVCS